LKINPTQYPVSIELVPTRDKLDFRLTFRNDILPREQAKLLLDQLDWLLINTIDSPDSCCSDCYGADSAIISVSPAKEAKIQSPVEFLHQFVEVNAREHPSKPALEFACRVSDGTLVKRSWTYQELDDLGNRYANFLTSNGACTGNLIAICFDKCPEAYLSILAILKAGCAYVGIDPDAPIARKSYIMEDSGSKLLLCTSEGKEELESLSGINVIALDEPSILDGISSKPPVLDQQIKLGDVCYCLYTSGTTGTPKGCEITHENAVQAMLSFQRLFDGHWDENSRWLQFASFHFDVSVLEQYWSWSVGICVTSCPRDVLFEDLAGTIRQLEITHIDLTPSLARLLHPGDVPSLCRGVFITGGEQLQQEILDVWGKHGVIYNGYGPTEATIGCTMLPRVPQNGKPSNIGPQFDNVGSFVLKPGTSTPVIRGGIGELCISGVLVGRGYLNRPQLTQERFQYIKAYAARVYRTGDLVRFLHDGSFCFTGRVDDQIKLRGQRVEIREINEVIKRALSNTEDVVTLVLKHPRQSKEQLVSFVATNESDRRQPVEVDFSANGISVTVRIRRACHSSLPRYMIPTHVVPLSGFPLSPNNKIDVRQLKGVYDHMTLDEMQKLSAGDLERSFQVTERESAIISVLAKMTGSDPTAISPRSSIFELGLDSISVISLARSLKDAGFHAVQPSLVMESKLERLLYNITY
jgi:amino acid adenylation domain-containing protein